MKQLATLLRIPRAHHAYIHKYGAYDFIEKCEDIVANNDMARNREQAKQDRAQQRSLWAIERHTKQKRGQSVPDEILVPGFYRDK